MNHLIVFMLLIVMYFELNEACALNRVIVNNQLGPGPKGIPLEYRCTGHPFSNYDTKVQTLNNYNSNWTIAFAEKNGRDSDRRTNYQCTLRWGARKQNFWNGLGVYRAGYNERCGQLREWAARDNGIWHRRDANKPLGFVRPWNMSDRPLQ